VFWLTKPAKILPLVAVLLAAILQVRVASRFLEPAANRFCDYANFYVIAPYLASGINVYRWNDMDVVRLKQHTALYVCGFANESPAVYGFFWRFRTRTYEGSLALWLTLCILMAAVSVPLIIRAIGRAVDLKHIGIAAVVLLVQSALLEGLALGQTTIVVTFLLVSFLWTFNRKQYFSAAVLNALIALVKINLAPIGVMFLVFRRWKAAIVAAAIYLAAVMLILAATTGSGALQDYVKTAGGTGLRSGYPYNSLDPSLANTIQPLLLDLFPRNGVSVSLLMTTVLSLCILAVTVRSMISGAFREMTNLVFGLWVTAILLITPFAPIMYFLFLFVPLVIVIFELLPKMTPSDLVIFAAAFVLIAAGFSFSRFPQFQHGFGILIGNIKIFGVAGLWWLQLRELLLEHETAAS